MAVSAEENTQRQHLWRMAGERTQNMRNENKNAKERKKHKKKNNVNDHFFSLFTMPTQDTCGQEEMKCDTYYFTWRPKFQKQAKNKNKKMKKAKSVSNI